MLYTPMDDVKVFINPFNSFSITLNNVKIFKKKYIYLDILMQ